MIDERQILYDWWETIPVLKFLDVPKKVLKANPIRKSIIKILLAGISDNLTEEKSAKRHALNVSELKQHLQEINNIKISTTNLYFHLNLLEEAGMIKVVTTLLEGPHKRNKTKYYGRVARQLYISDQEESFNIYNKQFQEFKKLVDLLKIELPKNFLDLPKRYIEISQKHYLSLANWLSSQESLINKENLDNALIFEFLKLIDKSSQEYQEVLGEISKIVEKEVYK